MIRTRILPLIIAVLAVLAVTLSWVYLSPNMEGFLGRESLGQMVDYAAGFLRPDLSPDHLIAIVRGAVETLAISALGTLLAVVGGLALALPASGRHGWIARGLARLVCNFLRSVPELVWAALMVLAVGLGPNAGTLALALHTSGVLGRLYAEALENAPPRTTEALRLAGSGRLVAFCYGTLPVVWPQLVSYGLYRWENNIRMAAILGVVGAGGLGQMLYMDLSLFREGRAATVILAMLVLVLGVDAFSARVRQRRVSV